MKKLQAKNTKEATNMDFTQTMNKLRAELEAVDNRLNHATLKELIDLLIRERKMVVDRIELLMEQAKMQGKVEVLNRTDKWLQEVI
jgi:hypothetical protein